MSNWKYILKGQKMGPVELSTLQSFIDSGTLDRTTLVQREGTAEWIPAQSVPELKFPEAQPAQSIPTPEPPPQSPPLVGPAAATPEVNDVEKNKVFAILSYISILFLVPLLAAPESKFARFHANQGLVLFFAMLTLSVGAMILSFTPVGCLVFWVPFVVWVAYIALAILGIVNAASGEMKRLPFIGHFQFLK